MIYRARKSPTASTAAGFQLDKWTHGREGGRIGRDPGRLAALAGCPQRLRKQGVQARFPARRGWWPSGPLSFASGPFWAFEVAAPAGPGQRWAAVSLSSSVIRWSIVRCWAAIVSSSPRVVSAPAPTLLLQLLYSWLLPIH